jgi:hypothetical protein
MQHLTRALLVTLSFLYHRRLWLLKAGPSSTLTSVLSRSKLWGRKPQSTIWFLLRIALYTSVDSRLDFKSLLPSLSIISPTSRSFFLKWEAEQFCRRRQVPRASRQRKPFLPCHGKIRADAYFSVPWQLLQVQAHWMPTSPSVLQHCSANTMIIKALWAARQRGILNRSMLHSYSDGYMRFRMLALRLPRGLRKLAGNAKILGYWATTRNFDWISLGCVLGSHGLGSHLVVPPTGNPPIGLGNRSQPNWDEGPT